MPMAKRYRNKESGVVYLVSFDKDNPNFPYKLIRESTGDYFTHAAKGWLDEEFTPLDSKPTKNKHKQCHICYGSGLTQDGMNNCNNCSGLGTFSLASTASTSEFEHLLKVISQEIFNTILSKNSDYGDSFHEQYLEYGDTATIIRLDDKLRRLKQLNNPSHSQKVNESIQDTLKDVAGYAILALISKERE